MIKDPLGYYQILGLSPTADFKSIKLFYREKAKLCHPDHNPSPEAMEDFQNLSVAYDILKNPQSRMVYDLLSLVYDKSSFPDMKTLKIYKAANGDENPFLRVFKLFKVKASFKKPLQQEENLIGTYDDAKQFINEVTHYNWLKGFWTPQSAVLTLKALRRNYHEINANPTDNFKLLVHNAAAYFQCGKDDKAYLSAKQALDYAPTTDVKILQNFLASLPAPNMLIPVWNFEALQKNQRKIPYAAAAVMGVLLLLALLPAAGRFTASDKAPKIAYYQEVRFNSGAETVDDVVVAKVFNIPVDSSDTKMLYYTTESVNVMYGPSEEFDVMAKARFRQTVRVTGYTPDEEWYRVMLDNGEMGFIKKEKLKPGIGRDIPSESKVFQNSAL